MKSPQNRQGGGGRGQDRRFPGPPGTHAPKSASGAPRKFAGQAATPRPARVAPGASGKDNAHRPFRPERAPGPDTLKARPVSRPPAETSSEPQRAPVAREAPSGALWLYGIHAVAAALANPARRLRRLLLTEEAETALRAAHAGHVRPEPWPLAPERTDRPRLDQLLGRETVHQGVALLADPLAPPALAQVLERPGVVVVLDQVGDPRNIGAILRSAAAFGAACVITQDRHTPQETGALAKAASGALETMPLLRAVNLARTLVALKASGCWVVGLDAGAAAALSGASLAGRRVALVLGAEGSGLRRLTRETCDEVASLAMPGVMESLNVAAAASVALYELSVRR